MCVISCRVNESPCEAGDYLTFGFIKLIMDVKKRDKHGFVTETLITTNRIFVRHIGISVRKGRMSFTCPSLSFLENVLECCYLSRAFLSLFTENLSIISITLYDNPHVVENQISQDFFLSLPSILLFTLPGYDYQALT